MTDQNEYANILRGARQVGKTEYITMLQSRKGRSPMKIAISGCGGFIGSYLIRDLLLNGYQVRGMDNFYKGHCDALFQYITDPNFEFIYGSVTNPKDCQKL